MRGRTESAWLDASDERRVCIDATIYAQGTRRGRLGQRDGRSQRAPTSDIRKTRDERTGLHSFPGIIDDSPAEKKEITEKAGRRASLGLPRSADISRPTTRVNGNADLRRRAGRPQALE